VKERNLVFRSFILSICTLLWSSMGS
jgi:hypothetical protein